MIRAISVLSTPALNIKPVLGHGCCPRTSLVALTAAQPRGTSRLSTTATVGAMGFREDDKIWNGLMEPGRR